MIYSKAASETIRFMVAQAMILSLGAKVMIFSEVS